MHIGTYVDSTKSLNFYGANYRACFNWDGAHNRALIIIHLKKSVKRSYINLEYKTLTNIVYEDKMSAQLNEVILFSSDVPQSTFSWSFISTTGTQHRSGVKTSYMYMRETNDLFIVNMVVLLKLKKFVVQNVRLPRYSGLSSS